MNKKRFRNKTLNLKYTESELSLIKKYADKNKMPMYEYILYCMGKVEGINFKESR